MNYKKCKNFYISHKYFLINKYLKKINRNKNINFLEIGLAYSESLEMWYEYFSDKSKIYGVDVHKIFAYQRNLL